MAKRKLKKYTKKPRANASNEVMENWLKKCKEIDKDNQGINAYNKKSKSLQAQVKSKKR